MSLFYQLIAAFGGGVFGALIGGTNAFIFTGITGLVSVAVILSGGSDALLNSVAGGPLLIPCVGFASGVAGLAVINKSKKTFMEKYETIESYEEKQRMNHEAEIYREITGLSVFTPLYVFNNVQSIVVAGVFGVGGYLLNYYFSDVWNLPIDTVALTIVISNVIVRLLVGRDSIFKTKRYNNLVHDVNADMLFNIIWTLPFAFVTAYISMVTGTELIVFYISAASLILNTMGKSIPVTHHISLPSAYAALHFNNIWIGVLVGLIGMILGEYIDPVLNDEAESLIDMPSLVIALLSFIVFVF